ncbi:phosphoribosylformylglycinamidine synthase I [Candidatus Peregrinibacteria bacterium]|nr:phosphoribosylformylglycinamidine synthase I [Candidatus Peregrinibacteria bacterium]
MAIAVLSFPGMNCEVETLRALRRNGFAASIVRWNTAQEHLISYDAYILPGGFSYEDRGRAGMVAAHHPLMPFLAKEATKGKTIIGICNGAQILVESGLIPLENGLQMALAKNRTNNEQRTTSNFRHEWIWIRHTCEKGRCAGSDWDGALHLPIAHGEGRFTTRDPDVLRELQDRDLIAFSYCDVDGNVSDVFPVNPNGSLFGIAGLCNPTGNILALMPHPERTRNGDVFFQSLRSWIERKDHKWKDRTISRVMVSGDEPYTRCRPSSPLGMTSPDTTEIFIDTVITNNEERTVETVLRKIHPHIALKQFRYIAFQEGNPRDVLCNIAIFNPHRDVAYVRSQEQWFHWNSAEHILEPLPGAEQPQGAMLLRRDREEEEQGKEQPVTGTCYLLRHTDEQSLYSREVLEILANPHASSVKRITHIEP